jgi:acyl carrier protein
MQAEAIEQLREVVRQHGRLSSDVDALGPDDDLYQAGMTSHASVNVMLGVEDAFDLEFPDEMLKPSVFQSLAAMAAAVEELRAAEAA